MKHSVWIIAWALAIPAPAQDVYKCRTPGGLVYQNRPCAQETVETYSEPAAAKGGAKGQAGAWAGPVGNQKQAEAYLAERARQRQAEDLKSEIAQIERDIAASQQSMNNELAALREKRDDYSRTTDPNDPLVRNMVWEMEAVAQRYAAEIGVKQDRIKILQNELANLK